MMEIDEAAKILTKSVDPEAKIKFGAVIDDSLEDTVKITVIATGFDEMQRKPSTIRTIEFDEPTPFKRVDDIKRDEKKNDDMEFLKPFTAPVIQVPPEPKPQKTQPLPETPAARKPLFGRSSEMDDQGSSNDELDIPAFIRKKMK
jgi:hypothetical protein